MARWRPRLFGAYLLAIATVTIAYGWHNARAANQWAMGEWLTNYAGGFVRRGLTGELILTLARPLHLPPVFLALAIQLLAFSILFVNTWRLTVGVRWSLPLAAILLSPATLVFHVLDPPGGFRKEILLFAGMSMLVVSLVRGGGSQPWKIAPLLLVLTQVVVFSHEPLALYLPYLFGAVFVVIPTRKAFTICAAPAVLAALSAWAAARNSGDAVTAAQICSSLGDTLRGQNQGLCGGAILYLSRGLGYAREETLRRIRSGHYLALYPIRAALTLVPFVLLVYDLRRSARLSPLARPAILHSLRVLALTSAIAGLASIALFAVAVDWGRWIYIHAVCAMLLILLIDRDPILTSTQMPTPVGSVSAPALKPPRIAWGALLVAVYATTWTLPHMSIFPGRFGYLDLIRYLRNYSHLSHSAS